MMGNPETARRLIWGGIFASLAAVLLWSRIVGLDLSFWHDEVYTVIHYAGRGPEGIFFGDYVPNNHVLFEIFAWITSSLFGTTEVIYRLWSVLPAIAATIWLTWWAARRFGPLVATSVALLAVVSPLLFQVGREARGYGLTLLAMVGLMTQADAAIRRPESNAVWRFAFSGLIGLLTLPVFVLPYIFAALPLFLESRVRSKLLMAMGASGVLAFVWYSPMLSGIIENSSQEFGRLVTWGGVATMSIEHLVFPIFRLLLPGGLDVLQGNPQNPAIFIVIGHLAAWTLIGLGARSLWQSGLRILLGSFAAPIVGTYLVMATFGMWVVDRFVSYLSLPLFVLIGLGVKELFGLIPNRARHVAYLGLTGLWVWLIFSFIPVAEYTIRVPHEAFKDASVLANDSGADLIVTNSGRPEGFRYYVDAAVWVMRPDELETLFCGEVSGYVFLEHFFRSELVDTSCLVDKGAQHARLEQRGRGQHIDLWLVDTP